MRGTVKTDPFPQTKLIGRSPPYNMQLWRLSIALLAEDVKNVGRPSTSLFTSVRIVLAASSEIGSN